MDNRYEIFMTPTAKPGDDEVSTDLVRDLNDAIGLAESWVINMGAHRSWVVDRQDQRVVISFENDGSVRYMYAEQKEVPNAD